MRTVLRALVFVLGVSSFFIHGQSSNVLWYDAPATVFEEALVLGNGKMGATVFGGVSSETIFLNDATLWSGEPEDPNQFSKTYKNIPLVRTALKAENYKLADSLNKRTRGVFSESFMPLGTLKINLKHQEDVQNYYRELDIDNAISKVTYKVNNVNFSREYFVSQPDQVMVIRLSSDKAGAINGSLVFESLLRYEANINQHSLEVNGYAPYHVVPSYMGNVPNAVMFNESKGTKFTSLIKVNKVDGQVLNKEGVIAFLNCTYVEILISVETSFNGFDKNPATEGKNNKVIAQKVLDKASEKGFDDLKQNHINDYQFYFKRVNLSLGETNAPNLPTNERLKRYTQGLEDKNLEILYFQYGRYLLISSSRTKGVPANLQGIWNHYLRPPWSSNYTMNINVEENYWLAEIGNLSEMHLPLLSFIEGLAETGKHTAKNFYNIGGWAAHHNSDIWAMSNQVDDFGNQDPNTVIWNMGGVWLSTHLWEHYLFTKDEKFLKDKAFPLMKGAVEFCLEWMIKDAKGYWITSPGTSPENLFITPKGYTGATSYGCTSDVALVRELLQDFIQASKALNINNHFTQKVIKTHQNLLPYQIGKKGNLQEWYYDWEDADPKHRHQSHLFGLYPGHQIHPSSHKELANACKESLEIKGDETTGWSKGWRINLWARLWDGNRAYKMYRELLRYVEPNGLKTTFHAGGGTYPNLLDAHPPFQIDGNFGGAAAVIEMIMQSTEQAIYLLPALPDEWHTGSIEGVCARGGFEISMSWKDKKVKYINITAKVEGETTLEFIMKPKEKSI